MPSHKRASRAWREAASAGQFLTFCGRRFYIYGCSAASSDIKLYDAGQPLEDASLRRSRGVAGGWNSGHEDRYPQCFVVGLPLYTPGSSQTQVIRRPTALRDTGPMEQGPSEAARMGYATGPIHRERGQSPGEAPRVAPQAAAAGSLGTLGAGFRSCRRPAFLKRRRCRP